MKKFVVSLSVLIVFTGCGPLPVDVNRKPDYLRNSNGWIVVTCSGDSLIKGSAKTQAFWDNNNLPHGTIHFVCRDGKAYLPENAPPKK